MDLKNGYWQAPLAGNVQEYTAFITSFGSYMFTRIPMGIKPAGPYFQHMMATVVFVGFVYIILELYLDDFAVHDQGKGFDQFVINLELVLERLIEKNVIVSPMKTVLNVPEVEFVGHQISEDGIHFTAAKLDKVAQVDRPVWGKGLKAFLGLTNWFAEHVENYAKRAQPLHNLIKDYQKTKNRKIVWTPEAIAAFEDIKEAINKCPKLYFLEDVKNSEIGLDTDASDYGIGAILFQTYMDKDGVEQKRIIGYMSRTLNKTQCGWSTYEKEAYAIYAAVMKFSHLLDGHHFIIRTDHKNLTYIRDTGSPKVQRWKYAIQDFDFEIEYLKGELNVVPDGFSRVLKFDEDALREAKGLPNANGNPKRPTPLSKVTEEINDLWEHVCYEDKFTEVVAAATDDRERLWALSELDLLYLHDTVDKDVTVEHNAVDEYVTTEHNAVDKDVTVEQYCALGEFAPMPEEISARIGRYHNSRVGHFGVEITLKRLEKNNVNFPKMRSLVRQFVQTCANCQKMSMLRTPIHTHPFTLASYRPMQRISMDTIGPLEVDGVKNCYILVIMCCFTRWVELYAMCGTTAEETADCLMDFFGRYGFADEILTDGGSQFINATVQQVFALSGGVAVKSTAYSKEEQGIVERMNKEVMRHIRAMVFDFNSSAKWGRRYVPLAQRILNSQVKLSTGVSPAALLFGNAITLDRNTFLTEDPRKKSVQARANQGSFLPGEHVDTVEGTTLSNYAADMLNTQAELIRIAQKNQL